MLQGLLRFLVFASGGTALPVEWRELTFAATR
jgi:hypothetical protein